MENEQPTTTIVSAQPGWFLLEPARDSDYRIIGVKRTEVIAWKIESTWFQHGASETISDLVMVEPISASAWQETERGSGPHYDVLCSPAGRMRADMASTDFANEAELIAFWEKVDEERRRLAAELAR